MKTKELLEAILSEQQLTNSLLEAMSVDAQKQVERVSGKAVQADQIMQQAINMLQSFNGGKNNG